MTILNWGSSVGNQTIDTSGVFFIPESEAQRLARPGQLPLPSNLEGQNDFGLGFRFTIDPTSGNGTFLLDANGLKRPSGFVPYTAPPSGVDILEAIGYPPGILNSGVYINALDFTTIRLGGGNDAFTVIGQGIVQSIRAEVNIDASQGYIFQSSIFAGAGDDTVRVLMPWQSVFKGGVNSTYFDAVFGTAPGGGIGITLNDDLTLEEVPFGDLIVLKGSRFDWDIEFKDGDGDGSVTLESILDERDYIAASNNNQISGFERIQFGDILFDLILYRQQESSAVFGQPDYYLNGQERLAPELNSDIVSGSSLWEAFRFNRTRLQGITGTATDQTVVFTGDANDTPFLVGALRFAALNTEAGNDIVEIGTSGQTAVDQASIDLGSGNDQLKVNGLFRRSSVIGRTGDDNIILTTIDNSSVDTGTGDDVVEVSGSASQTRFVGGDSRDVLLLPGSFASSLLISSDSGGVITFNDAFGNSITGFETIRFGDINLDALQTLSLSGPAAPVSEGTSASYTFALSGSALAAGESVAFTLQLGNDTAQFSTDLAALMPGSLQAASGIVVSNLSVDAGTGLIRAVATASRRFSEGSAIATLSLPVTADLQKEPSETVTVTLTDFVQAQTVTTTIADVPPLTIRLNGASTVSEGQPASYAVVLDGVGLAAGRSVTFSLNSASGTATEGVDFAPLLAELLQAAAGITLGGISTAADGTVTVTATNSSGSALAVGATLLSLQLPITTDSLVEANETFGTTLASSTAVVSSGVVTTTITDVVPTPTVALSGETSVVEGQSAAYAVSLGGSGLLASQSVTLTLDSASGTATEGLDYAALVAGGITAGAGVTVSAISTDPLTKAVTLTATNSSSAALAAGSQLLSFSIATTADLFNEGDETFGVSLTSANATVSSGTITTTLTDNDALAVRIAGPASVAEGSTTAPYTISLGSGVGLGAGRLVTFSIDSASSTATEGADFAALVAAGLTAASGISLSTPPLPAADGTISVTATNTSGANLAAGSALLSFAIGTIPDAIVEGNETFSLNLAGAAGVAVEGPASVVTTISDDDAPGVKLTGSASVAEGGAAAYAVSLDGVGLGAGRSVSFSLDSAGGTATEGVDFPALTAAALTAATGITLSGISTAADGTITVTATNSNATDLGAGASILSFSLAADPDSIVEASESYAVSLGGANDSGSITTTITDATTEAIRLSGSASVLEGANASYAVSLDGVGLGAGQSVTLTLDSEGGTATEGLDFAALVSTGLTAAPGVTLSAITTDPVSRALTVTATNTSGGTLAAGSQLLSFSIATTADLFNEGSETFGVSLASTNATVSAGLIPTAISDNNPLAVRIAGPATVAEGSTTPPYTISLASGVGLGTGRSVTFSIDTASGSAKEGVDFAALVAAGLTPASGISLGGISTAGDGTITVTASSSSGADLAAGSALVSFAIGSTSDLIAEGNEVFSLNLAGGAGVTVEGPASVVTTISDDDAPALKLTGDAAVAEGAAAAYALALEGVGLGAGRTVTFTLDSASGTATEGVDFAALSAAALNPASGISLSGISTAANGAITATATNTSGADLAAGFGILSFSLAASADSIVEGSERYSVSLSGANGSGSVDTTITDANTAVIRLTGSSSVVEGANASYAVSLDGVGLGAGQSVTLTLDSASGTGAAGAAEGLDFAALASSGLTAAAGVTFSGIATDPVSGAVTLTATNTSGGTLAAGSQLVSFSVATIQDQITEGDERFRVLLGSASATVANSRVETTIRDLVNSAGGGDSGGGGGSGEPPTPRKINGTGGADVITGSSSNNVIYGGKGADFMTGGGGSNSFQFKLSDGLGQGDVITDFGPGSDRIQILGVPRDSPGAKAFGGKKRLNRSRAESAFKVVDDLGSSDRSKAVFLYSQLTGGLAYNENGARKGFGRGGGVIAELPVLLPFSARDIQLVYAS